MNAELVKNFESFANQEKMTELREENPDEAEEQEAEQTHNFNLFK